MALKFGKFAASSASAPAKQDTPPKNQITTFLKTGSDAKAAFQQAEARAEARKAEQGKTYRFGIKENAEHRITFLDGDLDDEGMVQAACFYEHTVPSGARYQDFVCTADESTGTACPLCHEGKYPSSFRAALTIIDHTPYTIKNGPNAGTILKNTRRLFVMKLTTYKQLSKLAAKRGGLAGTTWDVTRSGDKSASVGSQFDFVEKVEDGAVLMTKYDLQAEDLEPLNYGEEITYHTPAEILALGFGSEPPAAGGKKAPVSEKDFSNQL